jgi:hypothetical protein
VAWFSFLHRSRTFSFSARAVDGSTHDIEIQSSSAYSALDLARRLCATKDWKLVGDFQIEIAALPVDPGERFQRLARLLDELLAGGAYAASGADELGGRRASLRSRLN